MKIFFRLQSVCLLTVLSVGCSDARLGRLKEPSVKAKGVGEFCTKNPDEFGKYTKFMFVIDKSGSNQTTDPQNQVRADRVEDFWRRKIGLPNDPNRIFIKWGYIAFQGSSAAAYITDGGNPPIPVFSNDPSDMENALSLQRSQKDDNYTPYLAGIELARQAIYKDYEKTKSTEDSMYMVFFMTDGYPTDATVPPRAQPASSPHFQAVENLVNSTAPGRVRFSTAYYGPEDAAAANGLSKMAEIGKGIFVDTNTQPDFDFDDLIVAGESAEPYKMKSFIVYNVNSSPCFDGAMGVDSDSDGLCDKDEIVLKQVGMGNFDPQNRFSFEGGYGDFVHYMSKKTGGKIPNCSATTADITADEDHDLLTECEDRYMSMSANGDGPTVGSPLNPDLDSDGMIDGIEYFMLRDRSAALDWGNLFRQYDPDVDKAYVQIAKHRNPLFPDENLPKHEVYDSRFVYTGVNDEGQSCYQFSQEFLQTYKTLPVDPSNTLPELAHGADENVILVYFIQAVESDPKSKLFYNYSFQTVKGDGNRSSDLKINDEIFTSYEIPVGQ